MGDIRETRDGCDSCPGPFGGPRNRKKQGNGGNRRSQGNRGNRRGGGLEANRRSGGNGRNRVNQGSKKKNGGGAKTAAEELAAKAGAVVPGKLPQGRRPPKPKNFDDLLKGNSKLAMVTGTEIGQNRILTVARKMATDQETIDLPT